jgi:hypothetical protein
MVRLDYAPQLQKKHQQIANSKKLRFVLVDPPELRTSLTGQRTLGMPDEPFKSTGMHSRWAVGVKELL